ncbi:cytochrome c family protein [Porphyrobacter sp. ULC335]|uniref:cytochrome c family protein n=1 Tax=Porphyrobacter sp. ULC335 TaxID=2854260 RepID=UPI002220DCBE|nr:cytochrome c family protein [Porphyrobacter sp. ULC335]
MRRFWAEVITGAQALPRGALRTIAVLALAALYPASSAIGNGTFEGVASCAGSTCHGRAEGNGAVVRQDEIATWQEPSSPAGAHSRAYAVLGGRRGQQIAASLGLGNAQSAPACLGCHATNAPAGQRGAKFTLTDGVGCESCHGPSGGTWLAEHYALPATHDSNIAAGLTPLDNPKARAGVCLDCHYGSSKPGQFVTHAMMAAGHPRISFELDLFSALQQHHNIDADYVARKGAPDSVRFWAVGQAEAVRRATSLFAQPKFAYEGAFPQFTFLDCHSCHRTITDGPSRKLTFETNPGRPIPFGNPPFNDENMIMLSAVAGALVPGEAGAYQTAARDFHKAMGQGPAETRAAAQALAARAGALSDALSGRAYGNADAFRIIAIIAGEATAPRFTDYAGSVQAVMAVDTLLNVLVREGRVTQGAAAGIRGDIARAYKAVEEPNAYRPADFRSALKSASGAIGRLQ